MKKKNVTLLLILFSMFVIVLTSMALEAKATGFKTVISLYGCYESYFRPDTYIIKDVDAECKYELWGIYTRISRGVYFEIGLKDLDEKVKKERILHRHYTGNSEDKYTSTEYTYYIKPNVKKFIRFLKDNWDNDLHGIDYCALSQEDKQFVTDNFNKDLMEGIIRITEPMPIPDVIKALNIEISETELAELDLNDDDQMMNIERLLQYWYRHPLDEILYGKYTH